MMEHALIVFAFNVSALIIGYLSGVRSERHRVYLLFQDYKAMRGHSGLLLGAILRGDKPL
jgi:hypothetical protein